MILLYGIILGICLSLFFSFGPSFFSMLQTSVHYGFRRSFPFPLGVSASDIVIVVLMMTVLSGVDMNAVMHNEWVACIAGVAIFCWGIYTFSRKRHNPKEEGNVVRFRKPEDPSRTSMFLKGFLLNFFNPLIWIYWISVLSIVSGLFEAETVFDLKVVLFFAGMLSGCLCFDLLKCAAAAALQRKLTPAIINGVNKCTGVLLAIFAVYLVVSTFYYKAHPEMEQESNEVRFIRDALTTDTAANKTLKITLPVSSRTSDPTE